MTFNSNLNYLNIFFLNIEPLYSIPLQIRWHEYYFFMGHNTIEWVDKDFTQKQL